ncbi:MAG TPA: prenyltransferase/squalene oxidase repeat-containing protein [Solirubrobacteraceae bacterium]|nr:prenyltransferase/squalene oxidase repeat-containing protein [Solirubrobacteraceae bacterium]
MSDARNELAALAALCATLVALAPSAALAATPPQRVDALDRTVRYLQDDQNADGGFGGEPGAKSNADFTAWVALALAAAGVNPRSQAQPGGVDAYSYLTAHASELAPTTDYERELLVVDASGTSPEDFGGVDLVDELLARQITTGVQQGAFPHEAGSSRPGMNDTIFAILALSPIESEAARSAVQAAASWVEGEQNSDGSWPSTCPKTVSGCSPLGAEPQGEVDMTGAAIQALNAAGRRATQAQETALSYLRHAQNPVEGGFPEEPGEAEPNVASTAWAIQGLWSAGENPETWAPDGVDPLSYMESLQQLDGHVRWKRGEEMNGVWMTAYVAAALAGDPWPIPAPPYTPPPTPVTAEVGGGGTGSQAGSGVIAGGGGDGAPLFSRPQPQSTGATPGGVRLLGSRSSKRRRAATRRRSPGAPRTGPVPTITAPAPEALRERHASGGARKSGGARATDGTGTRGRGAGQKVKGILLASATDASANKRQSGAPGLHSAGVGRQSVRWSALAILAAGALLALLGSQLERRRPKPLL